MKKIFAFVLFAASVSYAQPVIHSANLTLNLESEAFFAETEAFDPGPAGANRTWDFSALALMPIGSNETILPAGTPFTAHFPASNFCNATTGPSAGGYSYFSYDTQKMELLGEAFTGIGIFSNGENPRTYIEFPYTYNRVFDDTYSPDNIPLTATYDAYGTLILPFGTYHNVVRQKIVSLEQTNYVWFYADPFFPIAQTTEGGIGIMKNTAVLSSASFNGKTAFEIQPNPVSEQLNIRLKDFNGAIIEVFDPLGKQMMSQKATEFSTGISLSHCRPGIYLVKVTAKDRQASVQKIVKI